MLPWILLLLGFGLLIKAADWLVDGASALARRLKVSDLAIGLTVVAFGTSTPELFVNLVAAAQGKTALALGNVIGSNIANILLILGVAAIITPLAATAGTVWKEIPFSLLAALVLGIVVNDRLLGGRDDMISRGDGLILLCLLAIFFYYTVVAIGTSLPELATSAVAAYKGNADIAIGNVVGSNIFNVFFILGVTATIQPISGEASSNVEVLVLVVASLLLFLSMFTGRQRSI